MENDGATFDDLEKKYLKPLMFSKYLQRKKLLRYIEKGLQLSDDCRLMDVPNFGSEPFLVSIGKHVTISNLVTFITHDGGTWVFRNQERYAQVIKYGRITIHDNCFIGSGVILMPGVSIGPNAVVGAGSVVTKDVPENTVAAGNPARHIMTVTEYANRSLAKTPDYDRKAYKREKLSELLRLFPRPW